MFIILFNYYYCCCYYYNYIFCWCSVVELQQSYFSLAAGVLFGFGFAFVIIIFYIFELKNKLWPLFFIECSNLFISPVSIQSHQILNKLIVTKTTDACCIGYHMRHVALLVHVMEKVWHWSTCVYSYIRATMCVLVGENGRLLNIVIGWSILERWISTMHHSRIVDDHLKTGRSASAIRQRCIWYLIDFGFLCDTKNVATARRVTIYGQCVCMIGRYNDESFV